MDGNDDRVDEQLIEFIHREAMEELPVPPELQRKVERRIEAALATKHKMGWGSTALISGTATLALGLANTGSFDPAFVLLLTLAAVVYGVGVRQLTAVSAPPVQESTA
jgi:hypothetical protein